MSLPIFDPRSLKHFLRNPGAWGTRVQRLGELDTRAGGTGPPVAGEPLARGTWTDLFLKRKNPKASLVGEKLTPNGTPNGDTNSPPICPRPLLFQTLSVSGPKGGPKASQSHPGTKIDAKMHENYIQSDPKYVEI